MGASKKISLFAAILLSLPLPVWSQTAPLPTKIVEAKTVFLLSQTGDERNLDATYQALQRWGRWEVIGDREKADLILLLNTSEKPGPTVTHGSITSFPGMTYCNSFPRTNSTYCNSFPGTAIDTRRSSTTTIREYYVHVLDASSGSLLWTTEGTAQAFVTTLRRRIGDNGTKLYIEGYGQPLDEETSRVAECLMTKLHERGEFTFQNSKEGAEFILMLDVSIPGGTSRLMWAKAPEVRLRVIAPDGKLLWKG